MDITNLKIKIFRVGATGATINWYLRKNNYAGEVIDSGSFNTGSYPQGVTSEVSIPINGSGLGGGTYFLSIEPEDIADIAEGLAKKCYIQDGNNLTQGDGVTIESVYDYEYPYTEWESQPGSLLYFDIDTDVADTVWVGTPKTLITNSAYFPECAYGIIIVYAGPPAKATTPSPTDTHEGDKLSLAETTWVNGGGATSYNVYFGPTGDMELVGEGLTDPVLSLETGTILDYLTEYSWRVDSINEYGTTTGDVWTFTTLRFAPPLPTGVTIDDDGEPTGTPTGENAMIQVKRLVVAANNKIWYEDV